jgi:hypothetical protein
MDTPLAAIYMAFDGHIDFLRKTNPWRSKEDVEDDRIREMKPDPDSATRVFAALRLVAKPLPEHDVKTNEKTNDDEEVANG